VVVNDDLRRSLVHSYHHNSYKKSLHPVLYVLVNICIVFLFSPNITHMIADSW